MPTEKNQDDRRGEMPVTAEVGSEGGSYAGSTAQEATDTGELPAVNRAEPKRTDTGERADAVAPNPDAPDDGVRTPDDTYVMPD